MLLMNRPAWVGVANQAHPGGATIATEVYKHRAKVTIRHTPSYTHMYTMYMPLENNMSAHTGPHLLLHSTEHNNLHNKIK